MKEMKINLPAPISCYECGNTNKLYQCGDCMELFCGDHISKLYGFCEKWDGYDEDYCCEEFPTNHSLLGYVGECECKELL